MRDRKRPNVQPLHVASPRVPTSPAPSAEIVKLQTKVAVLESENATLRANVATAQAATVEANRIAQAAIVNINKRANDRALEICAAAGMGPVIVMPSATPAKMEKDGESGTGIGRMRGAIRAQIEKANSIQ